MITLASGSDLPCFEQSVRLGNGNIGKESPEEQLYRCKRLLATLYLRENPKKAEALYQRPSNMWEEIYLGDIRYYFLNDVGGALDAWQSAFEK